MSIEPEPVDTSFAVGADGRGPGAGEPPPVPALEHRSRLRRFRRLLRTSRWTSWLSECYHVARSAGLYYSQYGEDALLLAYLKHRQRATGESFATGTYVEIGANRPVAASNTYKLYRRGWRGLVIDATPGFATLFRLFRPADICEQLAIGGGGGSLSFYSFGIGSAVNSADLNHIEYWSQVIGERPQLVSVPKQSLEEVYRRHAQRFPNVDLLSVDVEGMDLEVLKSNDWKLFRPRILVVEQLELRFEEMRRSELSQFVESQGYRFYAWAPYSIIFLREDQFPFA